MYALAPEPEQRHRPLFFAIAGVATLALVGASLQAAHRLPARQHKTPQRITMALVEVTRPTPPPPKPPVTRPKARPDAQPQPAPRKIAKAEAPKPVSRKERKAPKPVRRKKREAPKPKPAAIKPPAKPAQTEPARAAPPAAPRLIAGLTLSSTVQGGAGARFGIGETTMGAPEAVAADPNRAPGQHQRPASADRAADLEAPREQAHPPVHKPAKLRRKTVPAYPLRARSSGVEGTVVLSLTIDPTGRVKRAAVVKGLGHGLDEAAREAAEKTLWKPATVDGKPIETTRRYHVRFQLEA